MNCLQSLGRQRTSGQNAGRPAAVVGVGERGLGNARREMASSGRGTRRNRYIQCLGWILEVTSRIYGLHRHVPMCALSDREVGSMWEITLIPNWLPGSNAKIRLQTVRRTEPAEKQCFHLNSWQTPTEAKAHWDAVAGCSGENRNADFLFTANLPDPFWRVQP